jgi:hypothetical protein
MVRDTIHTKSLRNKIKVWFSSTGWRPEDVYEKFPHTSNDLDNFVKFNPEVDKASKIFTSLQFVINSSISTVIIFTIADQPYLQTLLLATILIISTTLVTNIIENKKWGYQIELIRSLITALMFIYGVIDPNLLASKIFFYQSLFSVVFIAILLPINKRYPLTQ